MRRTVAALTAVLACASAASAAPFGAEDTSFGGDGWALLSGGDFRNARAATILREPGGTGFISAGSVGVAEAVDLAVVRYNAAGVHDTSFGTGGSALIEIGNAKNAKATALARQGDGKIVVAGSASDGGEAKFALARLSETGQPDGGFGSGGKLMTSVGADGGAIPTAVIVLSSGKILVAGRAQDGAAVKVALVRYLTDGTLDSSFGTGGIALFAAGTGGSAGAFAVREESDGKITVLGFARQAVGSAALMLRVDADGHRDGSFGDKGQTLTSMLSRPSGGYNAATWDASGRPVFAGRSAVSFSEEYLDVLRLGTDGAPDAGIGGGDGRVDNPNPAAGDFFGPTSLVLLPDGRLAGMGYAYVGSAPLLSAQGVVVYEADGTLDADFGSDGVDVFQFGSGQTSNDADTPGQIVMDGDHHVVVNGTAARTILGGFLTEDHLFALKRFSTDTTASPAFGGSLPLGNTSFAEGTHVYSYPDGSTLVGGQTVVGQAFTATVWKLTPAGALDGNFGTGGVVTFKPGYSSRLNDVEVGPDGKIWAIGQGLDSNFHQRILVARMSSTGVLDTTFAGDGIAELAPGASPDVAAVCTGGSPNICRDDGGKHVNDGGMGRQVIPVAGGAALITGYSGVQDSIRDSVSAERLVIGRVTDAGIFDVGFGTAGRIQIYRGEYLFASSPTGARIVGGKLMVGASMRIAAFDSDVGLLRLDPTTGVFDATFDGDGVALVDAPVDGAQESNLLLDDGSSFFSFDPSSGTDDYLGRMTAAGAADGTFGTGGFLSLQPIFGTVSVGNPVGPGFAQLADGTLVQTALPPFTGGARPPTAVATDAAGVKRTDFGTDGVISNPRSCGLFSTSDVEVDASGRLLLLGYGRDPGLGAAVALARYTSGSPGAAIQCPPVGSAFITGAGPFTCTPSFSGTPPITYAYQWLRETTAIAGATTNTYAVTDADAGHLLACRITASNPAATRKATSAGKRLPGDPFLEDEPVATPSPLPSPSPSPSPVASPSPSPTPVATTTPTPRLPVLKPSDVVTLPSNKKCVSRRKFRIRLKAPKGTKLLKATVFIGKKKVKAVKGKGLTAPVDLRGLPKGKFTIKVVAVTVDGRTVTSTRKYRTCAPKKRKS